MYKNLKLAAIFLSAFFALRFIVRNLIVGIFVLIEMFS